MADIVWEGDSDTTHRAGTLVSFYNMCFHHMDTVRDVLRDRVVVFCNYSSGVSLDGRIILFSGEVSYNWLNHIRNAPEADTQLAQIPLVEKALSQALRDIRVVRRKNQPPTLAEDHRWFFLSKPLTWPFPQGEGAFYKTGVVLIGTISLRLLFLAGNFLNSLGI